MALTVDEDLLTAANEIALLAMRSHECGCSDETFYWTTVKDLVEAAIEDE